MFWRERAVDGIVVSSLVEADMIVGVIVGILAGFLAGQIMKGSGYGIIVDLLLGLLGGVVGGFVLGLIGIGATGIIGSILVATFGAILLIWIVRQVRSNRGTI